MQSKARADTDSRAVTKWQVSVALGLLGEALGAEGIWIVPEERIAVQEQKADVEEKQELQRTQAETRARRKGGARRGGGSAMRLLLSPDRQNAQLGLKDTLG